MSLRSELIQIAAVVVSQVEDIDRNVALAGTHTNDILREVLEERFVQDDKWGPAHHPDNTWLFILMEEVGEAAKEVLDSGLVGSNRAFIESIERLGNQCRQWLESVGLDKPDG